MAQAPLRDVVTAEMKGCMGSGDKVRVGALRLIMAALKDRGDPGARRRQGRLPR